MKYRAEIDGLRALAVLPVILFHAGFELFSGGFVGVDVFFVISGYLITTIIISEMDEGKFSIVKFYERRARRILPALFFVMFCCLPFAWLWLTPNDLKDFGQSLVAVSTFSSNILFWLESGYFDTAAELKPLLHTWSLAVEEQYYIIFPIFLMLTWKLGIKRILILLLIVFFISLGIAQWATNYATHPKILSGAFYLLPARGWELLVGVFTAFYLKYNAHFKSHSLNQVLSVLGFGMILYSIIVFDKTTPFPSLYALVPTIGTGLLILCAVPNTLIYKLLSFKLFVGVGLISYSAYLWHQPLLAFARHRILGEVSEVILILLCIASLVMAWFSWRFIEKPFRKKNNLSRHFIWRFSTIGIIVFSLIGASTHFSNGFLNRLSDDELKILSFEANAMKTYAREGVCFLEPDQSAAYFKDECLGGENLIWGDSHAATLAFGLRFYDDFSQLTASACPPLINKEFKSRPHCLGINNIALTHIKKGLFKRIYLHSNWLNYGDLNNLQKTIDEIRSIDPDIKIKIIGGVPQWYPSVSKILLRQRVKSIDNLAGYMMINEDFAKVKRRDNEIIGLLSIYSNKDNVEFISILDNFCKDEKCISVVADCERVEPIAFDYGHLTPSGSKVFASFVLNKNKIVTSECADEL